MQCVWKSVMLTLFGTIVIRLEQGTSDVWQGLDAAQAGQPFFPSGCLQLPAPTENQGSYGSKQKSPKGRGSVVLLCRWLPALLCMEPSQGKKEKLPICL